MKSMIWAKTHNWENLVMAVIVCVGIYGMYNGYRIIKLSNERKDAWQQTACPSLLSIGRSSRDTLIIMKNLPDCNRFVLDNLK